METKDNSPKITKSDVPKVKELYNKIWNIS